MAHRKISELMSRGPVTIGAEDRVAEAARLMRDRRVGVLPVLEEGELVGILTDRDIVVNGVAGEGDPAGLVVRDCMTANPRCLRDEDPVSEAIELMSVLGVHRIPIVDRDWRICGMLSVHDLLTQLDQSGEVYEIVRNLAATRTWLPGPKETGGAG